MNEDTVKKFWLGSEQGYQEIISLYEKHLKDRNKDYMLEIGTRQGHSAKIWEEFGYKNLILIDVSFDYLVFDFDNKFNFITGDSRHLETVEQVKNILGGNKLDFLFIDGGHGYNDVKGDFELYKNFVKQDGIIVLHDLFLNNDMQKFFTEIKDNYIFDEIHIDYYGYGILVNK